METASIPQTLAAYGKNFLFCSIHSPQKSINYYPQFKQQHLGNVPRSAAGLWAGVRFWLCESRWSAKTQTFQIFFPPCFLEKKNAFNNMNVFSLVLSGKHMVITAFLALEWLTVNSFNCIGSVVAFSVSRNIKFTARKFPELRFFFFLSFWRKVSW